MSVDFAKIEQAPVFQYNFRDKDSGERLANGEVTFYQDNAHTTKKNIYVRTNLPAPNPEFVLAPNPQTLTGVGNFEKVIYLFPFNEEDNALTEKYFVKVTGPQPFVVPQFTLEGWPDVNSNESQFTGEVNNLITNGQFRFYEDIKFDDSPIGEIPPGAQFATTDVAFGEWKFERPSGSTSTNFVTVGRFSQWAAEPDGNPRNFVKLKCLTPDVGDLFKDLTKTIKDVNFMANEDKKVTLQFQAQAVGSPVPITMHLIKNFGTGGSAETTTQIFSTTVAAGSYQKFTFTFEYGTNDGKVIGTNDDDFIKLALRAPPGSTFELDVSDFAHKEGELSAFPYPQEGEELHASQTMGGLLPKPNPDGSSLLLPLVLEKDGFVYDDSIVGSYISTDSLDTPKGYHRADGSLLDITKKTSDGVPNTRLFNKIGAKHGNGDSYVTAWQGLGASNNQLIVQHNLLGTASGLTAGNTGWDLHPIHVGGGGIDYHVNAQIVPSENAANGRVLIKHVFDRIFPGYGVGVPAPVGVPTPLAQTSGFSIEDRIEDQYANTGSALHNETDDRRQYEFGVSTISAAGLSGKGYTWSTPISSSATVYTAYSNWFAVDGVGVDPSLSAVNIRTDLRSTDDGFMVALKTASTLRGLGSSLLLVTAPVAQSSYFEFTSAGVLPTTDFYVWYNIDSSGVDPLLPGKTGLEVSLTSAEANDVDIIIQKALPIINSRFFQVPDLRGRFLRGYDELKESDRGSDLRFMGNPFLSVPAMSTFLAPLGSEQLDALGSHNHETGDSKATQTGFSFESFAKNTTGDIPQKWTFGTNTVGARETRPLNKSANYFIHY